MSFQTVHHEVGMNKDQLFNLLLGQGDLLIKLADQNITIEEFSDCRVRRINNGVKAFSVKILGVSDSPRVSYVEGSGAFISTEDPEKYKLSLELHLQDGFE